MYFNMVRFGGETPGFLSMGQPGNPLGQNETPIKFKDIKNIANVNWKDFFNQVENPADEYAIPNTIKRIVKTETGYKLVTGGPL